MFPAMLMDSFKSQRCSKTVLTSYDVPQIKKKKNRRHQHSSGCIGGCASDNWSAIPFDPNSTIYDNLNDYINNNIRLECTSLEEKLNT